MDEELKKMRWASRRGMLELDLILGPFMESRYAQLTDDDRARYRALMACEDQDLFAWLLSLMRFSRSTTADRRVRGQRYVAGT